MRMLNITSKRNMSILNGKLSELEPKLVLFPGLNKYKNSVFIIFFFRFKETP